MVRDVEREAEQLGVPYRMPSNFPVRSVLAARVALVGIDEGFGEEFTRAAFAAHFVGDADIARDDVIDGVLASIGHDGPRVRERANAPEIKQRLRQQVERARSIGIFGSPSFVVGDELFWGNDRLERALQWARK